VEGEISEDTSEDLEEENPVTEKQGENDYEITKMNLTYNEIQAYYPQLSGNIDEKRQDAINDMIQKDIYDVIRSYSLELEPTTEIDESEAFEFILTIDYQIKRKDSNYLSVFYTANYSSETAAYPSEMVFTTNIDLVNLKRLRLIDIISIDENFALFLKGWEMITYEEDNEELEEAVEEYLSNLNNIDMFNGFINADKIGKENTMGVFSYLTEDSLGISMSLPHVLGNYVRFERKYSEFDEYLNINIQ